MKLSNPLNLEYLEQVEFFRVSLCDIEGKEFAL